MVDFINEFIARPVPPQGANALVGGLGAGQQLRSRDLQNQAAQMQLDQQNRLQQLASQGNLTPQALTSAGLIPQAGQLQDVNTSMAQQRAAQQQSAFERLDRQVGLLEGVTDAQSYQNALQTGLRAGILDQSDLATLPAQFDPQALQALKSQAVGVLERFKSQNRQPLVQVSTGAGDKEFAKLNAQAINDQIKTFDELGQQSVGQLDQLNRMTQLLEVIETGPFEQTRQRAEEKARALGLPFESQDFSSKQEFEAVAAQQVLDVMATQKGPQTEGDRAYIATTRPALGKTKQANLNVIDFAKSRQKINRHFAKQFRELRKERNTDTAIDRLNALQDEFQDIPAGTVVNGRPVTFNQFEKAAKKRGLTFEQALEEWRSVAQ